MCPQKTTSPSMEKHGWRAALHSLLDADRRELIEVPVSPDYPLHLVGRARVALACQWLLSKRDKLWVDTPIHIFARLTTWDDPTSESSARMPSLDSSG